MTSTRSTIVCFVFFHFSLNHFYKCSLQMAQSRDPFAFFCEIDKLLLSSLCVFLCPPLSLTFYPQKPHTDKHTDTHTHTHKVALKFNLFEAGACVHPYYFWMPHRLGWADTEVSKLGMRYLQGAETRTRLFFYTEEEEGGLGCTLSTLKEHYGYRLSLNCSVTGLIVYLCS